MIVLGLCGRTGSGKSTVGEHFGNLGINCIDTDKVSREVTQKGTACLDELTACFGKCILNTDNTLNRALLAQKAMNDNESYALLNRITHKHILIRTHELLTDGINIIDAPLLFESGLNKECDAVIGVISSDGECLKRVTARDGITVETAMSRLKRQKDNDFLISNCDYIIKNDSDKENLIKRADAVLKQIKLRFCL